MKRIIIIIAVCIFTSPLFPGCGGGGSGDGSVADLEGTWLGWIEDDGGNVVEFSLEIDEEGNVTEVSIDGDITGDTGHINEDWDENLFHVLYDVSDSLSRGYMIVDDQYSHATYGDNGSGDSNYYCGVLEKGATSPFAYTSSDIVANYTVGGAYSYTNDSGTWNWVGDDISMIVDPDLTFSGSVSGDTFSGGFDDALFDANHGRYEGTFTHDTLPPVTMDIKAFLSPDGTAVAAFASEIDVSPTSLEDFILIGLKK